MSADLSELIAKLEAATEGSRDLDNRIALALDFWPKGQIKNVSETSHGEIVIWFDAPIHVIRDAPAYTASIDMALSLVPAGLSPSVGQNVHHKHWNAYVLRLTTDGEPDTVSTATAPTPALALCITALRARATAAKENPHAA